MHKPLPTIPHSLHHHPLPSAREIHLFKDLFSVNQQPICLVPRKNFKKQNMVPFCSFDTGMNTLPLHPLFTAFFFNYFKNISRIKYFKNFKKFFASPIFPKLIKSKFYF